MRIRRATHMDAAVIGEIRIRGWRAAYRGLLPEEMLAAMTDEDRVAGRREGLRRPHPGSGAWVVVEDDRVAGFAFTGPARDADAESGVMGELLALYVEPDRVGCGLGRALLAAAVDDLRQMGYRRASLWVLHDNARARRFYEIAGWVADGCQKVEELEGAVLREVRYVRDLREAPAPAGRRAR